MATNALKPVPYQPPHLLLQKPLNNHSPNGFSANIYNNKLAQKYLMNSMSNYYESIAANQLANNNNNNNINNNNCLNINHNPNSPLLK